MPGNLYAAVSSTCKVSLHRLQGHLHCVRSHLYWLQGDLHSHRNHLHSLQGSSSAPARWSPQPPRSSPPAARSSSLTPHSSPLCPRSSSTTCIEIVRTGGSRTPASKAPRLLQPSNCSRIFAPGPAERTSIVIPGLESVMADSFVRSANSLV